MLTSRICFFFFKDWQDDGIVASILERQVWHESARPAAGVTNQSRLLLSMVARVLGTQRDDCTLTPFHIIAREWPIHRPLATSKATRAL